MNAAGGRRAGGVFFVLALSTLLGILSAPALRAAEGGNALPLDESKIVTPPPPYYLPLPTKDGLVPAKTTEQVSSVLQTAALLTFLTLAPSLLILMTCFTRITIVLSFLRRALATQTLPPDQVLVGLSLFLTIFIMAPTWQTSWNDGLSPFLDGKISATTGKPMNQEEMFERVMAPQRAFMWACIEGNRSESETLFFMGIYGKQIGSEAEFDRDAVPLQVLIPIFITSELKRGFWMGFLLYLPFLILDVVIASVLMSMGMMMLPPVMISLPFKIVLFVLVDGWRLVMEGIVMSFPLETLPQLQATVESAGG